MQTICLRCNKVINSTSGQCSSCSPHLLGGVGVGEWTFHSYSTCIYCGKSKSICVTLPYGSRYDGESICADCISSILDPILDRVKK